MDSVEIKRRPRETTKDGQLSNSQETEESGMPAVFGIIHSWLVQRPKRIKGPDIIIYSHDQSILFVGSITRLGESPMVAGLSYDHVISLITYTITSALLSI